MQTKSTCINMTVWNFFTCFPANWGFVWDLTTFYSKAAIPFTSTQVLRTDIGTRAANEQQPSWSLFLERMRCSKYER